MNRLQRQLSNPHDFRSLPPTFLDSATVVNDSVDGSDSFLIVRIHLPTSIRASEVPSVAVYRNCYPSFYSDDPTPGAWVHTMIPR